MFIISVPIKGQISPGELSKQHAAYEGLSNCTKCHVLGKAVTDDKCLTCHKEIHNLIDNKRGYHSSDDVKSKKCFNCHNEHHGRKFQLIKFDSDKFNHKKAGFELLGKHSELKCAECHTQKFNKSKKNKTYLGLNTKCLTCHQDYHKGSLGENCISCHNNKTFKEVNKFDHNKANFKLTGKHSSVDCNKCHKTVIKDGKETQIFKGLQFSSCSNCHTDQHSGKFGSNCESCHVTNSFKEIKNIGKFDHNKTNFPLIGKHTDVTCLDCHVGGISNKPKYEKCSNCHEDYHEGQLTKNGIKRDCSVCHIIEGFNITQFPIEEHNKTKFQLLGSHLAITCQSCHYKEEKWQFLIKGENCINCHENVHKNFISKEFLGENNCQNCHNNNAWSEIKFDHKTTGFELSGVHGNTSCKKCHFKTATNGSTLQIFSELNGNCENCHTDNHAGQFKEEGKTNCTKCHTFNNWKPEKFIHENTKFKLEGAHAKVNCDKCHKIVEINNNKTKQYKFDDVKCSNCHI